MCHLTASNEDFVKKNRQSPPPHAGSCSMWNTSTLPYRNGGPPLTILMSLMVAMLRTKRFTRTMAGPSRVMIISCYIYIFTTSKQVTLASLDSGLSSGLPTWKNVLKARSLTCAVYSRRSYSGVIATGPQNLVQDFLFLFSEIDFDVCTTTVNTLVVISYLINDQLVSKFFYKARPNEAIQLLIFVAYFPSLRIQRRHMVTMTIY